MKSLMGAPIDLEVRDVSVIEGQVGVILSWEKGGEWPTYAKILNQERMTHI